ncbi:hypothetical protein [Rhizobium sp. NLR22b]|uniref:hypothetical protein n=1 Tax=Rhizobium sp. NLR22b TaxID=2731115 RepID=UPI001C83344D|nr:hypothetical protein [Rhizobium sp. NLR22b]MBX5238651.1 hypothetical protein [Rhizobium sp. NLR22b]
MNEFAGFATPRGGGWWAMTRFARDAKAKPILGEGGSPLVFQDELSTTKAALHHVLAYFNGHLVASREIAGSSIREARRSAADRLFQRKEGERVGGQRA